MIGTTQYETRIKELVENFPDLMLLVEPLLVVRRVLREQISVFIAACLPLSAMMRCVGA